jgi:hypothetical protein
MTEREATKKKEEKKTHIEIVVVVRVAKNETY